MSEKRGFPLSILEKLDENPTMEVGLQMDVNFYSLLAELSDRFQIINKLWTDTMLDKETKEKTVINTFNQNDTKIFADIIATLVYAVAYDQGEKGFISKETSEEYQKRIADNQVQKIEAYLEEKNESKGTS